MQIPHHIRIVIPLTLAGLVDIALTLAGQSPEYWAGDHSLTREGNPFADTFLTHGPWAFATMGVSWLVLVGAAMLGWNHRVSRGIGTAAFAGHTFGGAAWLLNLLPHGWVFAAAYVVAMCLLYSRDPQGSALPSVEATRSPAGRG